MNRSDPQRIGQLRSDLIGAYEILSDVNATLAAHSITLDQHTVTLDAVLRLSSGVWI